MSEPELIGKDSKVDIQMIVHCDLCKVEEHYPNPKDGVQSAHIEEHPNDVRIEYARLAQ